MNETTIGREPLQVIEIEQPLCTLEYGVSPCTAAIGVTGSIKCFNGSKTCQDLPNYDPEPLLLRFCKSQAKQPEGIFCVPSLMSVSTSPTQINVVGGSKSKGPLGIRAELSVTFKDHPYSDVLVDKYRLERNYIATDRGSYWSKWLARNPYYNGYIMRVYDGYVGQSLSEMGKRTYLIDTFSGPDSNQNVMIKAKDVLKLADNDKAQAPGASTGKLIVDYTESASMDPMRITGGVAAEYTGVSTISDTEINLTGITRSIRTTEAEDQDAGDRVQICLEYTDIRPDDLANDLLTTYGNVPASFITLADWSAEASVWLEQFRLSTLITEPTGVTDLLGEITEQALFYIWWDERAEQIRLRALRPAFNDSVKSIDNFKNILAGTFELKAKPKERISQVWVFFGQRNPVEKLDDEQNFRSIRVRVDADAESDLQYGEQRIRKIYSRWIQSDAIAIQTTARLLSRFRDTPEYIAFALDAKDRAMWTGDLADVTVDSIVDETGGPRVLRWQVISAEETISGEVTEYQLQRFEYGPTDKAAFIMATNAPIYANASEAQRLTGGFIGDDFGLMPNGDPGYTLQ